VRCESVPGLCARNSSSHDVILLMISWNCADVDVDIDIDDAQNADDGDGDGDGGGDEKITRGLGY
jgi:hypothetical protein